MNIYDKLQIHEQEKIYIHNEIFRELTNNKHFSTKDIVFVYAYYCLVCYLYRYCKYGRTVPFINNEDIKEMLGYQRKYGGVDYLIKKGGVLDHIGYTESIRDFPIEYKLDSQWITFDMYSELDQDTKRLINMGKNFVVKKPVKAFHRTAESEDYDGTFYDISNTHLFDVNVYVKMLKQGLSINEFYVYQFLRHKCDLFKSGYNASYEQIQDEIRIPARTIMKITGTLEKEGYIEIIRDTPKGKSTLPNTYKCFSQLKP